MANATSIAGQVISIVLDGSTDWTLSATGDSSGSTTLMAAYVTSGLKVDSITFKPSQANDVMIIHEGGIDAAEIFNAACPTTASYTVYYHGATLHPVIDASDCTIAGTATVARVIIIIR